MQSHFQFSDFRLNIIQFKLPLKNLFSADIVSKCIFLEWKVSYLIDISLNFVP